MTLYEINEQMLALVDPETGEITDLDALDALSLAWDEKVENIALWIKNLKAETAAIKAEEESLYARRKAAENKAERLNQYLDSALNGQQFKTAKVVCSYRKSKAVEVDDGFVEWARANADDLLTYKEPTANKTAIKEALGEGRAIEHATIVERESLSIK